MTYYEEPAKRIPIRYETDVLVAGGGPAGVAAAIAAARAGAKVVLVEQCGAVGGIATSGLMSHWAGRCGSNLYAEILRRSAAQNGQSEPSPTIHPAHLKALLLTMLEEAGVTVLLYTFVSGVIMEGNTLVGIITESKSGRAALRAKVVVDGTGDGDVAAKAGAAYHKGRETDGKMQPATLMFKVGGVDMARAVLPGSFETTVPTNKGELQALAREHLPHPAGHVLLYRSTLPGVVTCNMTNCIDIDGTRAEDLTRAERVCRSQIDPIIRFLRAYAPGYEACYLLETASLIGIRETRHFRGCYTITGEDILAARQFPDWVVRDAHFNFDVHNLTGAGLDKTGMQHGFPQQTGYTIPYGCLVPESVDGLLLSGRNISGTHQAHSNFRVMPICVGIGEAGGVAAALCCKHNVQPRQLHAAQIQALL